MTPPTLLLAAVGVVEDEEAGGDVTHRAALVARLVFVVTTETTLIRPRTHASVRLSTLRRTDVPFRSLNVIEITFYRAISS